MIDSKAIADELRQARRARLDAEAAGDELEELLWEVQHVPQQRPLIAYDFDGFGRAFAEWRH